MSLPPRDLATIEKHAGNIGDDGSLVDSRLSILEERVEFLSEELGQESKYRTELSDYIKDLRTEIAFVKTARIVFGIIATLVALSLLAAPIALLFIPSAAFVALPPYPKSALLVGFIAGGVLLIQAITKSVYRSAHERQSDEFIPPQIKAIYELTKGGGP